MGCEAVEDLLNKDPDAGLPEAIAAYWQGQVDYNQLLAAIASIGIDIILLMMGGSAGACSFDGDTRVVMSDGTTKPIS